MDFQKAADWATKSIEEFDGKFGADISKATTTLLQAKLSIRRQHPGSTSLDDFLSLVESAIGHDSENGFLEQAAIKMELLTDNIQELSYEKLEHWLEVMEGVIKNLATSDSEEADMRRAGLYQKRATILASKTGQVSDPAQWDEALKYLDEAVALYVAHKRLVEAANTRQIQSVILFRRFQFAPSVDLLSRCLELIEIALEFFTLLDNLTFITSASECRSKFLYAGWGYGWVIGDDVLKALQNAEVAQTMERADMTVSSSLEAVSRRQHFASSSAGLRNIYRHAFSICLIENRATELWAWTQRAKARSLSDQLGLETQIPLVVQEHINQDASRRELTQKAEDLWKQISDSDPMTRLRLRGELDRVHSQMKNDPLLKLSLDIRNGTPVELKQMRDLGEQMKR
jgi:tetratricopeptide (TPR) repeat protein